MPTDPEGLQPPNASRNKYWAAMACSGAIRAKAKTVSQRERRIATSELARLVESTPAGSRCQEHHANSNGALSWTSRFTLGGAGALSRVQMRYGVEDRVAE